MRKILLLTESAIPVKKRRWSPGSEQDEVSFETLLGDDRSALERGEDRAFGLRKPEAGLDERIDDERGVDSHQESFKARVLKRGDGNRFAITGEVRQFLGRDEVDLVQDLDDELGRDSKFGQTFSTWAFCSSRIGLAASWT